MVFVFKNIEFTFQGYFLVSIGEELSVYLPCVFRVFGFFFQKEIGKISKNKVFYRTFESHGINSLKMSKRFVNLNVFSMVLLCISCVMWIRLTTPFLHPLCNVYYIDNSLKTSSNFYLNIILGTQDFMSCFEWIDIYLLNSFKIFEGKFIWSTICTMRCSIGYKGFKYSNYLGCYFNNRMFNRDSCGLWW